MKLPNRTTIETFKTILISVLITAALAFYAGIKYQEHHQAEISSAVAQVKK